MNNDPAQEVESTAPPHPTEPASPPEGDTTKSPESIGAEPHGSPSPRGPETETSGGSSPNVNISINLTATPDRSGSTKERLGPSAADEAPQVRSLFDVSQPWTSLRSRFHIAPEDIRLWSEELRTKEFLLLTSYDAAVLLSAAQEIAAKLKTFFAPHLFAASNPDDESIVPIDPFLPRRKSEPCTLVVVEAPTTLPRFVEHALRQNGRVEALRSSLRNNGRCLLVLTNDRCLGWSQDPAGMHAEVAYVPYIRVPFLPPRLRSTFDDWAEIYEEILKQREGGLWSADDEHFYAEVRTALGGAKLLDEIKSRREGKVATAARVRADRLLSPSTPLENAVLFVATFFPNIAMRTFERLLVMLLGERRHAVTSMVLFVDSDGEGHSEDVPKPRLLRELWGETYPAVLERCLLQMVRGMERDDRGPTASIVDFSKPEMRGALRDSFFGAHAAIFEELLHAVRDSREMLGEGIEVARSIASLMVDIALLDPHELSGPGLGGWLPSPLPLGDSPDTEELAPRITWALYLSRIRALLQNPALRDAVTGRYLPDLLRARRYADVLEIVWVLRDTAGFSALPWLKRLCDSGDELTCLLVCDLLRRAVRESGSAEMVRAAHGWLSSAGERVETPRSAEVAKRFFVGLNEGLLFHPAGPSPLLAAAQRAGGEDLIEISVSWLFNPAIASLLRERFAGHIALWARHWLMPQAICSSVYDEPAGKPLLAAVQRRWQETANDDLVQSAPLHALLFPAVVIADWAVELLGQDPLPPGSGTILDRLVPALARTCSGERRLALETLWSTIEESLLDVSIWIEELAPRPEELEAPAVRTLRAHLTARRRAIQQLRRELRSRSRARLS
jgi:hypothetical protein